jgi:lipid-A-disaccharide synthase-like uncharacterized protein
VNVSELLERATEPVHILGFVGQGVFFTRFALQWIVSERKKESVIPVGFWWCSMIGGTLTLIYGVLIASPPIVMGQLFGNVVYVRNLVLVYRKKREMAEMLDAKPDE